MSETLDTALAYHRRGWSVIPIRAGTKKPAIPWQRFQDERPSQSQIREWWRREHGIAVICGTVSGGLNCRDYDQEDSYRRWTCTWADLAGALPTVRTARGHHVYFRGPEAKITKLPDGELRGAGYCLLPPSRHPDGPIYTWTVPLPDGDIPHIGDVVEAGFFPPSGDVIERVERVESVEAIISALSALSITCTADAIRSTLPTATGRRNRAVFELARALKAIPALADAPPEALREHVVAWHRLGREAGTIGTEPPEETWGDFLAAWPKVKFPRGTEPMSEIIERAKQNIPAAADRYEGASLRLLVSLCCELQAAAGDAPFYLGCATAARVLGVTSVTAWRYLLILKADGIVTETEKGDIGKRRASRFRYIMDVEK